YLAHGLLLLNNIPGDTRALIEEYGAGVNIDRENPDAAAEKILAMAADPCSGENARRLYRDHFTEKCFHETLSRYLEPLLKEIRSQSSLHAGNAVCGSEKFSCTGNEAGLIGPEKTESCSSAEMNPASSYAEGADKEELPEISAAMTVYNGERFLDEQLDSILMQLSENDELVVSLDPSEDASAALLAGRAEKDPRIRVIEGPGKGVVRNVENALRHCRGKKIFLADQDDVWLPGKVEKVSRMLDRYTLVLHDARVVDKDLEELTPSFMDWRKSRMGIMANLIKNSYIGCCMAFRRELLDVVLPFPENLPMHDQWIGVMAEKHGTVRFIRIPLMLYRRHEGTETGDHHAGTAQMMKWRFNITKEVMKR
ncbi:MAG: glycosyltransferase, partial [Eubacterium sp.]|nr:glycosyltransferase [Eubacterium sp.]